jgi:hypothetical protein
LWSSVLAATSSESSGLTLEWVQNRARLLDWLASVRKEWEGDAADHLGVKIAFNFNAKSRHFKPPVTPQKTRSKTQGVEAEVGEHAPSQPSAAKKRKSPTARSADEPHEKASRTALRAASADTEAWVHRFDAELPGRQASAVQLRCRDEASGKQRILVVTGAYPVKAVGFTIAEAFSKAVDAFDPHPNKGKNPPGMTFALMRDGQLQSLKATVKIVQAVQDPGDTKCAHGWLGCVGHTRRDKAQK